MLATIILLCRIIFVILKRFVILRGNPTRKVRFSGKFSNTQKNIRNISCAVVHNSFNKENT